MCSKTGGVAARAIFPAGKASAGDDGRAHTAVTRTQPDGKRSRFLFDALLAAPEFFFRMCSNPAPHPVLNRP